MRRGLLILAAIVPLVATAFAVLPAQRVSAAFPGTNGLIAWGQVNDPQFISQVWVMNADGTGQTQLTTAGSNGNPAWSPDGSRIVFASNRDGNFEIYAMNADGTGQTRLTDSGATDIDPVWSPDGAKIAWASYVGWNYEIYVMNADGTGATNITNDPAEDILPSWQPGGSKIAFQSRRTGRAAIFTVNSDGTGLVNLSAVSPTTSGEDESPDWSPDGSEIVFDRWDNFEGNVFVMNADGTGVTQITTGGSGGMPAWSPDGSKIVFMSRRDFNDEIYVMNVDGTGQVRLTNNAPRGATLPADWYPDWQPARPVDSELPVVAYTGNTTPYVVDQGIHITCDAADNVGVVAATCADIDGPAWRFGLGAHDYSATATDAAGNVGNGSTTFTVVATYPSMSYLTTQWVTKAGVAKDLLSILNSAARAEATGRPQAEAGKLGEYRSLLRAQSGKAITSENAQTLIALSFGL